MRDRTTNLLAAETFLMTRPMSR